MNIMAALQVGGTEVALKDIAPLQLHYKSEVTEQQSRGEK